MRDKTKFKPLKFGTSGLRDTVVNMTDMECYINTKGFISFLKERGEITGGENSIALAGDYRSSTPRIAASVEKAIIDSGCQPVNCGEVPTPTLANFAITKEIPGIMVTGSHIPDDRNGIKFVKKSGEVLKSDEKDILSNVAKVREDEYAKPEEEDLFDDEGMFKEKVKLSEPEAEKEAVDLYIKRYLAVFPSDAMKGLKIVLYQHSAVGRDIVKEVLEGLGAEVITKGRSDSFVPVDTEKVSEKTIEGLREWAGEVKPFALISTDGDSDRPLLADEEGNFLPGDKLGALVSIFLKPDFVAIPISANDAVVSALEAKDIKVVQTKIGSPYVIKAMNDELAKNPNEKVVSWESNGGFLLGSDWEIDGKKLKALPTRDALLPLVSSILLAKEEGKTISNMIESELPHRYTHADVVDDKTPGCENYTADMGKEIIKLFSPKEGNIYQADFDGEKISAKEADVTPEISEELTGIKDKIAGYFSSIMGDEKIKSINFIDGIRIKFENDDVAHLRPSGNAPEFRMYATSNTQERADEIVESRKKIVPEIIASLK